MKSNQLELYNHFTAIATNVKKTKKGVDYKPIIRENAKKYAAEIDATFHFSEAIKSKPKK